MKDCFTTRLAPGQALTLGPTRRLRCLVVTQGRLWLTVSGQRQDHWLQAGDGLMLPPGCQGVVEAWPEAAFQLLEPARPPRAVRPPVLRPTWVLA